ncbi:spermidine synthase [Solwaraspora sp. WMMD791]|uniref:spermidine synthase n=1 Tax=Solwaraspora sp. WMMD791 TaxID=3016086 RepID=UPI00249AF1C1|nr:spermidine synthase [Solwaraspora sp. WMMD791]WFE29187.1 spermidine synthase [Solwaraspora sp. WMMD791]
MPARFAELDWRETPMGEISLRRRRDPTVDQDVYEVKLGDEFLMSSLFTVAEVELARLALDAAGRGTDGGIRSGPAGDSAGGAAGGTGLDVVVGGLGLGYTAVTVLDDPAVRSLVVVDALDAVIDWHRRGLVPHGLRLAADPRCQLHHGDFFVLAGGPTGFDPDAPGRRWHAIVVDIDHSPTHLLHPGHADFYQPDGLRRLADHLHPGGVFALWSNDPPDDAFTARLAEVYATARAEVVTFANPLQGGTSANTVYLATRA